MKNYNCKNSSDNIYVKEILTYKTNYKLHSFFTTLINLSIVICRKNLNKNSKKYSTHLNNNNNNNNNNKQTLREDDNNNNSNNMRSFCFSLQVVSVVFIDLDCKTVVFGRLGRTRSAVSAILACEAREPHTPLGHLRRESVSPHSPSPFLHSLQTFRLNTDRRTRSQKIRLLCSLSLFLITSQITLNCEVTTFEWLLLFECRYCQHLLTTTKFNRYFHGRIITLSLNMQIHFVKVCDYMYNV